MMGKSTGGPSCKREALSIKTMLFCVFCGDGKAGHPAKTDKKMCGDGLQKYQNRFIVCRLWRWGGKRENNPAPKKQIKLDVS